MNKLLIIGSGFLGLELSRYFKNHYEVTITNRNILDVTKENSIKNFFSKNSFDYILYCAGIKNVSYCENNTDESVQVNAESVKKIVSRTNFKKFIYISTDYVFDGVNGNYSELDAQNPNTVYGKSKLLGELYTKLYSKNYIIVRTSGVYGLNCPWLEWLLKELDSKNQINCYANIFNTPTYSINLAKKIHKLIDINYDGIIHLTDGKCLNRFEFYQEIAKLFNRDSLLLKQGYSNLFPTNLSLNTYKYHHIFPMDQDNISNNLKELYKRYEN
jgi:dTDP-4-dehydrorhamnose reductase